MVVLYPATRFAFSDLTIKRVLEAMKHLQTMVDSEWWAETIKGIPATVVQAFMNTVNDLEYFKKVETMVPSINFLFHPLWGGNGGGKFQFWEIAG